MERIKQYPCRDCGVDEAHCYDISYWRHCEKYKDWLNWNWEQFKAGFYALKNELQEEIEELYCDKNRIG